MAGVGSSDGGVLVHRALLCRTPDDMIGGVAAFAREDVEAGERTMVLAAPRRLARVRRELGRDAPVRWVPNHLAGARPGIAFDDVRRFLAARAGGGRLRVAVDWDLGARTASERRAFMRWEAAATALLRHRRVTVLCCHDAADPAVAAAARATHPEVWSDGTWSTPARYRPPRLHLRECASPRPPPGEPMPLGDPWDLGAVRERIVAAGAAAGVAPPVVADFAIAANEIAANALWHARGPRDARVGVTDGALVCEVRDGGPGLEPLLAHVPPLAGHGGGRGLWIAHQLADVVQVIPAGDGTRVRIEVAVPRGRVVGREALRARRGAGRDEVS